MADIVSPEVRSHMMAGIRSRHTKPEIELRRALHSRGFRFRLHDRRLPGCPDIVLPRYRATICAHGCFWHGHECPLFRWPATRPAFWRQKIGGNQARDARSKQLLQKAGWRVCVVWECALRGPARLTPGTVIAKCEKWLKSDLPFLEIGCAPRA
jgi:DNA mismatch endonuclease (patch repair protein)